MHATISHDTTVFANELGEIEFREHLGRNPFIIAIRVRAFLLSTHL